MGVPVGCPRCGLPGRRRVGVNKQEADKPKTINYDRRLVTPGGRNEKGYFGERVEMRDHYKVDRPSNEPLNGDRLSRIPGNPVNECKQ